MDREPIFQDTRRPISARVKDLISRMSVEEKIGQMMHKAPAIPRLNIPAYDWWNECLHGVARAGIATVFPQAIGLAATWDVDLIQQAAEAISTEARAKHHAALRRGDHSRYTGLTYWSPNINIFRDPRWGRGQETYGEDPYLTAKMGVAFVRGLQGDDPRYLKVAATAKHYAVHSGPEAERHGFDAQASARDLQETYLPAFQALVQEGRVEAVMGAYNRTNGEACCASPTLLEKILRQEWGFAGQVVSDCGAIDDLYQHHHVARDAAEAAALAVKAGCDLNCGNTYAALGEALQRGLLAEADIDRALERLFLTRFRLGMFDPPEQVPYTQIPIEMNDSPAHQALALQCARESLVLLKNDGTLPLKLGEGGMHRLAVIGPNADNTQVLLGNYHGTPSRPVSLLEGIRQYCQGRAEVGYAKGCSLLGQDRSGFTEAVELAGGADAAVLILGLSQAVEGEEGQEEGVAGGRSQGDRETLGLPGGQEELLQAVAAAGKPVILVLVAGSAVAVNWADEHVAAILQAWYPGQAGGQALAEVLFGEVNPSGRLPVTVYHRAEDLPPFRDYDLRGRTYRYFRGEPLYPFGWGLSYINFSYSQLSVQELDLEDELRLEVAVQVENTGDRLGDEVAQLYLWRVPPDGTATEDPNWPAWQLRGFQRVALQPGESQAVRFDLGERELTFYAPDGSRLPLEGVYRIAVGGRSPGSQRAEGILAQEVELFRRP